MDDAPFYLLMAIPVVMVCVLFGLIALFERSFR